MALDLAPPPERVKTQAGLAAALDVGAGKIACLVAPIEGCAGRALDILGAGVQGVSLDGADFESCARAIRIAADEAERGAESQIHDVVAAYSGPGLHARIIRGQTKVRGGEIGVREAQAALAAAIHGSPSPGKAALHVAPLGYAIDGGPLTPDPRGRQGASLAVEACVVTAPGHAVEALRQCIRAAGLAPSEIVAAPYAAALAVVTEEERADGVLVIDLGAGGAGLACLCAEGLVHVDHVAVGGARMTRDLAKALGAPAPAAERAKLLHGLVGGAYDPREALEAPRLGADGRLEGCVVERKTIVEALAPRFREAILLARARVMDAHLGPGRAPRRAVLVGGGAQLAGARELAQELLGMPVRIGRPLGVDGMSSARAGPAFAVAAGLIRWRLERPPEAGGAHPYEPTMREVSGAAVAAASRAWAWLKDNF